MNLTDDWLTSRKFRSEAEIEYDILELRKKFPPNAVSVSKIENPYLYDELKDLKNELSMARLRANSIRITITQ